ncbi:MAG: IS256 family transposase [Candidatus Enterosoma sp.]|nr:IS256 family transposase [Bacilli bacterium]MDY3047739.1 IS256 family transposase [Candidatus Enterosoma sp.]
MKSIQQICQLSDKELKAVLSGDGFSYGELLDQALDFNRFHKDIEDLASTIYDRLRIGFQVMLEKVIGEEFFTLLEDIADRGGNASRNGYYSRKVRTFLGDFNLQIPRARYENFQTKLLAKYGHDIGDVRSKVLDLYLGGMTQSEVVDAIASVSGIGISREKVGEIVRSTIGDALKFNEEAIEDCPIVYLDATYIPMKRAVSGMKSVEKEGILVALGITKTGHRKILGFVFGETECLERWKTLLKSLKERGLKNPVLFITDGLSGMPDAVKEIFPSAKHQRCTVHYKRNLMSYVRQCDKGQICSDFNEVMAKPTKEEAMKAFEEFKKLWSSKYRGMTRMLNQTTDNIFTYYDFPEEIRESISTSNAIESFNSKLKRETRKRILANSEDNATIVVTALSKSYNKSCGRRRMKGLNKMTTDKREEMGFDF